MLDDCGNLISGMGVKFLVNGVECAGVSQDNGTYYYQISFNQLGKFLVNGSVNNNYNVLDVKTGVVFVKLNSTLTFNISSGFYNSTIFGNITLVDGNFNRLNESVVVSIGNNTFSVSLINGSGNFALVNLNAGNYVGVVTYEGNDTIVGSSKSCEFNISKLNSTLTLNIDNGVFNSIIGGNVTLKDSNNNNNLNGTVIVSVNNKNYTVVVNEGVRCY